MSRHLRVLRVSGLVKVDVEEEQVEQDARLRVYRLRPEPFADLQAWLDQMQAFWTDQLEVFKAHVDSIQAGTGSRFSLIPPENATGSYVKVVQRVPVKIVFEPNQIDSQHLLAPGMSAVPEVKIK